MDAATYLTPIWIDVVVGLLVLFGSMYVVWKRLPSAREVADAWYEYDDVYREEEVR